MLFSLSLCASDVDETLSSAGVTTLRPASFLHERPAHLHLLPQQLRAVHLADRTPRLFVFLELEQCIPLRVRSSTHARTHAHMDVHIYTPTSPTKYMHTDGHRNYTRVILIHAHRTAGKCNCCRGSRHVHDCFIFRLLRSPSRSLSVYRDSGGYSSRCRTLKTCLIHLPPAPPGEHL